MVPIEPHDSLSDVWQKLRAGLSRANQDRKHPFRLPTLCTVSEQGPAARTLVMRHFDATTASVRIFTDRRSAKFVHIQQEARVSLHWYHPRHRTQIQMQGEARLMDVDADLWKQLPFSAKTSYLTVLPPGHPIDAPAEGHQMLPEDDSSHFQAIEIVPVRFELLQLHAKGHLRAEFVQGNDFFGQWLVP
ncbi:MAG: pyridoxamine 5'-phosphate oxidase family protein [Bacteroidota bacterium]